MENRMKTISRSLGKPFYVGDGVLIYNLDCLEGLRTLDSNLFDLTATSPPYNIGKEYESILPIDQYLEWTRLWTDEVFRTSRDNASFWLNLGYVSVPDRGKSVPLPYLLWDRIKFYLLQEV